MGRWPDGKLELRYDRIERMIISGMGDSEIIRDIQQSDDICHATAKDNLATVYARIAETNRHTIDEYRSTSLSRYYDLYRRSYDLGRFDDCRKIQAQIDRITGIEQAIDTTTIPPIQITVVDDRQAGQIVHSAQNDTIEYKKVD